MKCNKSTSMGLYQCQLEKGHKGPHSWEKQQKKNELKLKQIFTTTALGCVGATKEEGQAAIRTLLYLIGENPDREGLLDTPKRVIKAWGEMTSGYEVDPKTVLGTDFDGEKYDQMVVSRNIEFVSCCEHHMLPFIGVAHVAYIPKDRVVGLSKMARLVDVFAKRLQIQERMTQQIANTMWDVLKPRGVGVIVQAKHSCMSCRGVRKQNSDMITTCLRGNFQQQKVKEEFILYCK